MKYRNKLDLWEGTWQPNELLQDEKIFTLKKRVNCAITAIHGGTDSIGATDVKNSYTVQRILVRKLSIKEPKIDMYFKDSTGAKYEILDFFPNHKNNSEWEFRTKIVREV